MDENSINPLESLSIDELIKFREAIDSNFSVVEFKGIIEKDLKTRWFDLYQECLKYAYWNHRKITEDYPRMSRTFMDIIKIMVREELFKLNQNKK
jgi:hypothetical protein